ncbi:arginase [Clostridium cadaveris]|uniref:arginase n=1 Tax=Clostridium cadaveris TaxID=1529 RepID=UPI0015B6EA2C|nr:arginase [Clostridium cadaveris]NWK12059.1 arginase [Clostridium cadaveris]
MDINIIGMPLFYGSDVKGVEEGPTKLRNSGIREILSKKHKVYDLGDIVVKQCQTKDKFNDHKGAKYLQAIVESNNDLAHNVYLTLKDESFPLTVGGDHSLALGTIAGSAKYYKDDLAVIWIDAHGDFNTTSTTPSGNVHGMPLAASAGVGIDELKNVYFSGNKIKSENIFILCARDLDKGEIELLNNNKVNVLSTEQVKEIGIDIAIDNILKKIKDNGVNNIHVSFDIDCMDPEVIPGTGTRVEDGITLEQASDMIKKIFSSKKVRALDFVEFNPVLDKDDVTLNNCLKIFEVVSDVISK